MEASSHALLCDLLGEDPLEEGSPSESVEAAARRCPRGAVVPAREGGEDLAVVRLGDGRLVVVPDACPHDGGRISDGFVEGGVIVCARHGWEFNLETGECTTPGSRARLQKREG